MPWPTGAAHFRASRCGCGPTTASRASASPSSAAALTGALRPRSRSSARWSIGEDPHAHRGASPPSCGRGRQSAARRHLHAGASAIDIALWDIKGKALGQPCGKLLGGFRDRVADLRQRRADAPALRSTTSTKAGAPAGRDAASRQMKMQLGAARRHRRPSARSSASRVMREAIGPDIDLMCDINQLWRVHQAIDIGQRHRAVSPLLARGRDDPRRLRRPGPRRRRAHHADRRRRVRLRHRARSATCWRRARSTSS